ncbi:hypothetical protein nbrc107696_07810 [Gordonia spumicola]|uniref:Gram-positive cocci surface proteins LPxTG domain-containing protein n=1 Tax=Gordonia spumicola TaxID=589161 RepID=A0A7I9V4H3_9ACTN|nr:hypothetical protein [Gordonia spumicola]GEE00335.1 hypothetical protein nbrc107696_07810 [Gordonia spumicola]
MTTRTATRRTLFAAIAAGALLTTGAGVALADTAADPGAVNQSDNAKGDSGSQPADQQGGNDAKADDQQQPADDQQPGAGKDDSTDTGTGDQGTDDQGTPKEDGSSGPLSPERCRVLAERGLHSDRCPDPGTPKPCKDTHTDPKDQQDPKGAEKPVDHVAVDLANYTPTDNGSTDEGTGTDDGKDTECPPPGGDKGGEKNPPSSSRQNPPVTVYIQPGDGRVRFNTGSPHDAAVTAGYGDIALAGGGAALVLAGGAGYAIRRRRNA